MQETYGQVVAQFSRYIGHVSKYIGGIMTTPKTIEQSGPVVEFVPEAKQKEAMAFLQTQLFKTPKWLINNDIAYFIGGNKITTISNVQDASLSRLVAGNTLSKLLRFEAEKTEAYTASEMLGDLRKGIWSELDTKQPIDIYRRNLQKSFVDRLIRLTSSETVAPAPGAGGAAAAAQASMRNTDVVSLAKYHLRNLSSNIKAALPFYKNASSRAHLQDEMDRITIALDPRK